MLGTVNQACASEPNQERKRGKCFPVLTIRKRGEYDIKKFHNPSLAGMTWRRRGIGKLKEGDRAVCQFGPMETDMYDKDGVRLCTRIRLPPAVNCQGDGALRVQTSSRKGCRKPSLSSTHGRTRQVLLAVGEERKSTFPYADKAHKVSWPKPDESGFSYADDGAAQLCVAWA